MGLGTEDVVAGHFGLGLNLENHFLAGGQRGDGLEHDLARPEAAGAPSAAVGSTPREK